MITVDGVSAESLQIFLKATRADVSAGMTKEVLEAAARQDSSKLAGWVQATALESVREPLGEKVIGLLQDDAVGIFVGAWAKCVELKKCAEETLTHPGEATVVLTEHEFSYAMSPKVEVTVDGVLLGSFEFSVKMLCTVSALELHLEAGCLTKISGGKCDGGASISLAGQTIWHRELLQIDLPGELKLTKKWALAKPV
jgi:hypothetical protein